MDASISRPLIFLLEDYSSAAWAPVGPDVDELRAIYEGEDTERIGPVRPLRAGELELLAIATVRSN